MNRGNSHANGECAAGFPKELRNNWEYMELRQVQVSIWQFQ